MNRRELFKIAPAALLLPAAPAVSHAKDLDAAIVDHGREMLALTRQIFPDASRIGVKVLGLLPEEVTICADAVKREWVNDCHAHASCRGIQINGLT